MSSLFCISAYAPSTFLAAMNDLFRPYLHKFILAFFDDILIYRSTTEKHLQHLKVSFELLSNNQFYA